VLKVTKLQVKSLELDHLDVYWEIEDSSEDAWDYTFTVERSESPMGPFDQVSEPFSDKYNFRDSIVNLYSRWRQLWYRVKVTKKSDGVYDYTEAVTQEARPPLDALEVRRLELIAFREHIGRLVWIFPVRTFGQRCPDCYDKRTGNRRRSQCPTCFCTTYVRGYLDPIATYIQIDPSPKHAEPLQLGKTEQSNTSARTPYFPPIKPKDIIVEAENRRWRIERVSTTQRLRAVLHHEIVMHEIPKADIEYTIPINIDDLMTHEPSPQREFTNPHNLESLDGAEFINNLLLGYGYRP
jgi:hypothetical protein